MIFVLFGLIVVLFLLGIIIGLKNAEDNAEIKKKIRVCPKCGVQNDEDVKFCRDCGFSFDNKMEVTS